MVEDLEIPPYSGNKRALADTSLIYDYIEPDNSMESPSDHSTKSGELTKNIQDRREMLKESTTKPTVVIV
jgi:hypothetical protein